MKAKALYETSSHASAPCDASSLLVRAFKRIARWRALARQRRALASLSEEALKDIGLTRAEQEAEWKRPFWDDPFCR
ncbi:DUF1127 domain-containing protein [Pseudomonas sp. Marseille-QA0892]